MVRQAQDEVQDAVSGNSGWPFLHRGDAFLCKSQLVTLRVEQLLLNCGARAALFADRRQNENTCQAHAATTFANVRRKPCLEFMTHITVVLAEPTTPTLMNSSGALGGQQAPASGVASHKTTLRQPPAVLCQVRVCEHACSIDFQTIGMKTAALGWKRA